MGIETFTETSNERRAVDPAVLARIASLPLADLSRPENIADTSAVADTVAGKPDNRPTVVTFPKGSFNSAL